MFFQIESEKLPSPSFAAQKILSCLCVFCVAIDARRQPDEVVFRRDSESFQPVHLNRAIWVHSSHRMVVTGVNYRSLTVPVPPGQCRSIRRQPLAYACRRSIFVLLLHELLCY
jgi:hypothetical protein